MDKLRDDSTKTIELDEQDELRNAQSQENEGLVSKKTREELKKITNRVFAECAKKDPQFFLNGP